MYERNEITLIRWFAMSVRRAENSLLRRNTAGEERTGVEISNNGRTREDGASRWVGLCAFLTQICVGR